MRYNAWSHGLITFQKCMSAVRYVRDFFSGSIERENTHTSDYYVKEIYRPDPPQTSWFPWVKVSSSRSWQPFPGLYHLVMWQHLTNLDTLPIECHLSTEWDKILAARGSMWGPFRHEASIKTTMWAWELRKDANNRMVAEQSGKGAASWKRI